VRLLTGRNLTKKEREIESEFGEPFGLVIQGFAEIGYGPSVTAKYLGIGAKKFRERLAVHDPNGEIPWPEKQQGEAA